MTYILLAISVLAVVGVSFLLFQLNGKNKLLTELSEKLEFTLKEDPPMKIEMNRGGLFTRIVDHINALISKYNELLRGNKSLEEKQSEMSEMDTKIKGFEESISNVTLLTDIGKQITTSLDTREILSTVFEYISASMDVDEIELLHFIPDGKEYYSIDRKKKIELFEEGDDLSNNGLIWSMQNNREIILNDAHKNYAQFLSKPIISLRKSKPQSVVCMPLRLNEKFEGALAVLSSKKDAYNNYHVDFIRGIASYVSVALDNANVYDLLNKSKDQVEVEKKKSDELLLNILPAEVAEELKQKGQADARKFDNACVLFSDFEDFTGISETLTPEELVDELNECFKAFDHIIDQHGIEKIKTIGDAYMAAGGLSESAGESVEKTIRAALDMQDFIQERRKRLSKSNKKGFKMRIGIHAGPVVAGIVGDKKFQYDIWGDTVNTASRMETSGVVDRVNISEAVHKAAQKFSGLAFEYRGEVEAKRKGAVKMYFVDKA